MHSGRFVREARITTNIAHLSATRLKQVEFPVPPLDEQRRIVDIVEDHLSRLDAADVQLSRCLRRIKVMTSATMQAVSDGPLRPLSEVASIGGGIQKQAKRRPVLNRAPFLRVANVTKDGLNLAQVHEVELFPGELDRYRLEAGDLLVVEGNGSPEQIGRAALWDGSIPDAVHQNHLIRVRPGPDVLPEYLEIIWNSPSIRESVRRLASSSSGLHTLSVKKLSRVLVPVSGITSQRQAVVRVGDLREKGERLASAIRVQKRRSFSLRRAFLAAAFSGQLTESAYRMNLIEETAARGLV
jgi:type I restriction enzyme S subunit